MQLLVGGLGWAILVFLVAVGVFLACRWLLLWYFRVNEAVAQLSDAAESLRAIRELLAVQAVQASPPAASSDAEGEGQAAVWPTRAA